MENPKKEDDSLSDDLPELIAVEQASREVAGNPENPAEDTTDSDGYEGLPGLADVR